MTTNTQRNEYYCSAAKQSNPEYDAEDTYSEDNDSDWGNHSEEGFTASFNERTQFDDAPSYYGYKTPSLLTTYIPNLSSSIRVPVPIQFASKSSGYDTQDEFLQALDNGDIEIEQIINQPEDTTEATRKAAELSALIASLPKFPKTTLDRMAKEEAEVKAYIAEQAKEEAKLAAEAAARGLANKVAMKIAQKNKPNKALPFGHRRNGGGKGKKGLGINEAVIAARRTARRVERKEEKVEEAAKQASFLAAYVPKEVTFAISITDERTEEEKEADELEAIETRNLVTKAVSKMPELVFEEEEEKKIVEPVIKKVKFSTVPTSKKESPKQESKWETVGKKSGSGASENLNFKMGCATAKPMRMQAIEMLADKKEIDKKLAKTQMCNSVGKGKCRHGKSCRFAHNIAELSIADCFFGDKCKMIRFRNGQCENKGDKCCMRKHDKETDDNYFSRCGIQKPTEARVATPSMVATPVATPAPWAAPKMVTTPVATPAPWAAPKVEQVQYLFDVPTKPVLKRQTATTKRESRWDVKPTTESEPETILRVPKELVIVAMEMAMKSGKKNIRVIII